MTMFIFIAFWTQQDIKPPCGATPGDFCTEGVEFTTLGIGSSFPTSISMALRNAFHRGRVNIPNVTLVRSVADYKPQFQALKGHLINVIEVDVVPSVRLAPWTPSARMSFENSWAMAPVDCEAMAVCARKLPVVRQAWDHVTAKAVMTQWILMLHASALAGNSIREEAASAVELAREVADAIGVDPRSLRHPSKKEHPKTITFCRRLRKAMNKDKQDLEALVKELKLLAKGNMISGLSDQEMAQRLAIGTVEGRHHARAMDWKGCTLEDFEEHKSKFVDLAKKYLDGLRAGPEDENQSAISLESNREVLLQKDLLQGIREVSSQYFLVECLPVVGLPLKVHVFDGSVINPWLVRVDHVARHTPFMDSVSIDELADEEGIARLAIGQAEKEEVNAVCPVFAPDICPYIGPFIRSGIYQLLMTRQVCKTLLATGN